MIKQRSTLTAVLIFAAIFLTTGCVAADLIVDGTIGVTDQAGAGLLNETATGTNPTLVPNQADKDTGVGRSGIDRGTLVAGGMTVADFRKTGVGSQLNFRPQNNIARPALAFGVDSGFNEPSDDLLSLSLGAIEAIQFEDPADLAAGETSLWLFDRNSGTVVQVTVGSVNSGGAGFKVLRIPN